MIQNQLVPADNVYKFLVFNGMVALVFGLGYPAYLRWQGNLKTAEIQATEFAKWSEKDAALTTDEERRKHWLEFFPMLQRTLYPAQAQDYFLAEIKYKCFAAIGLGVVMIGTGLWFWWWKVQRHEDLKRQVELELLQIELAEAKKAAGLPPLSECAAPAAKPVPAPAPAKKRNGK